MTVEQWLAISEQVLPGKLAQALTPEKPGEHDWEYCDDKEWAWTCLRCGAIFKDECDVDNDCPVPDPIKIDWNTAMEYRQGLYTAVINEIWQQEDMNFGMWKWWAIFAQPRHYLIAAAMATERAKE